jgi:hypothetical protein
MLLELSRFTLSKPRLQETIADKYAAFIRPAPGPCPEKDKSGTHTFIFLSYPL